MDTNFKLTLISSQAEVISDLANGYADALTRLAIRLSDLRREAADVAVDAATEQAKRDLIETFLDAEDRLLDAVSVVKHGKARE